MQDTQASKAELRQSLRAQRRSLSPAQQQTAAINLVKIVAQLSAWQHARHIALYQAADGEIDTHAIAELARSKDKNIYLPVICDNELEFAHWAAQEALTPNRYGIPEPSAGARRQSSTGLDILFMPLVGWDSSGARLGMGGGFYDRALAGTSGPLLVGLAHTCQQIESVPQDDWDIVLDFVATDVALYDCRRRS